MQTYLDNLDLILDALKIRYQRSTGRFFFPCPIHNSNNYNSVSIYTNTGKWRCFTKHCEHEKGDTLLGFVAAVLECDETDAINFCNNVLEGISGEVTERPKAEETVKKKFTPIPRKEIVTNVNPNIPFYLRRGYSKEILEKYDLFICTDRTSPFDGRVVIPVYDDTRTNAIGMLGRSLYSQCEHCEKFHASNKRCPKTTIELIRSAKWRNSAGFPRSKTLFNYWFSKDIIREKEELVLVESPGNVMKLVQAGIENCVAIFGTELTSGQLSKIKSSGAKRIYLGLDNDTAGYRALEIITDKLNMFDCIPFIPETNDFGEMTIEDIRVFYDSCV